MAFQQNSVCKVGMKCVYAALISFVIAWLLLLIVRSDDSTIWFQRTALARCGSAIWDQNYKPEVYPDNGSGSRHKDDGFWNIDDGFRPFSSIMSEHEALRWEPCNNNTHVADVAKSRVELINKNRDYRLGDDIELKITLFDHQGQRKTTGGDLVKILLKNTKIEAFSPARVVDNRDGTYSATVTALWTGNATIVASLRYSREAITAFYRMRREMLSTRHNCAIFQSGRVVDRAPCHPNITHLQMFTDSNGTCNFTYINSGMPWYCAKPRDIRLMCEDWQSIVVDIPYPKLPVSKLEDQLVSSSGDAIPTRINVTILGPADTHIALPTNPCRLMDRTSLWRETAPTGFYYNKLWKRRQCKPGEPSTYVPCVQNRNIYMLGDSTLRHWYSMDMMARFSCKSISEKWTKSTWHKPAMCRNDAANMTMAWFPHSQPFSSGHSGEPNSYTLYSMDRRIDDIRDDEHAIVVIHLMLHIVPYHHNAFRMKMTRIRASMERLFRRNGNVEVFIKAPHTYTNSPVGKSRLTDFYAYVYTNIMYDVFIGLHHKVIFLNNMDTSNALELEWNHPPNGVVSDMVDQMFSFIC